MFTETQCEREVVKIAENNVEIRYFLRDADGDKVYMEEFAESYGNDRLEREKKQQVTDLKKYTIDKDKTVANGKKKAEELGDMLDEIEVAMNS